MKSLIKQTPMQHQQCDGAFSALQTQQGGKAKENTTLEKDGRESEPTPGPLTSLLPNGTLGYISKIDFISEELPSRHCARCAFPAFNEALDSSWGIWKIIVRSLKLYPEWQQLQNFLHLRANPKKLKHHFSSEEQAKWLHPGHLNSSLMVVHRNAALGEPWVKPGLAMTVVHKRKTWCVGDSFCLPRHESAWETTSLQKSHGEPAEV